MPTFVGFSTQHVENTRVKPVATGIDGGAGVNFGDVTRSGRKFRTTDEQLVIQDFINALNIPQGQKPGRPDYGTSLWSFIFEPNTLDTQIQLEEEIKRIAALDPRIILNSVTSIVKEHGILVELELAISPFNNAQTLAILFDQNANKAFGA
jgi:phage baseplate assembly protein W